MNYRWFCFAALITAVTLFAGSAVAESPVDKEEAIEADFNSLITQAQGAFTEGDFEAAIEYLVIANRLDDEPRLFLNIARSYEELDQCHLSLAYYQAFLDAPEDDESLTERAEKAIESGAADCDEYSDELSGRILLESDPNLALVYIDDEPYGMTPTETAGLAPGSHTVRFERDGYEIFSTEIDVAAGGEREVVATLEVEVEEEEEDSNSVEPLVEDPGDAQGFAPNPVALGLVGVGLAGVATGGVFDLVLISQLDDEREDALQDEDHDLVADLTRQRQTYANVAIAGYVSGAVLLTGGLIWLGYDYWHASGSGDAGATSWRVAPEIGADRAGFSLFRRF